MLSVRAGENPAQLQIRRTGNFNDPNRIRLGDTRPMTELVALRGSSIQIPEMVGIPGIYFPSTYSLEGYIPDGYIPGLLSTRIMIDEVSVGLFRDVTRLTGGYKIAGNDADDLQKILQYPANENDALTYVSLSDAEELATRLSGLTGRSFRVQTEKEWVTAKALLKGANWTWTKTPYLYGKFVLRRLDGNARISQVADLRFVNFSARLVEDLFKQ
jgi:hypothetical protein